MKQRLQQLEGKMQDFDENKAIHARHCEGLLHQFLIAAPKRLPFSKGGVHQSTRILK